ncbi:MAG: GDSL-type esterase/lipase family protein [Bacteroidia bacterium]|nr:GDSL-type esterase/lipase family protein [Bacteroidia bacterium]
MRLNVPTKVILLLILLQILIFCLSYWHEKVSFNLSVNQDKEIKMQFSSLPRLLGTTDYKALAEIKRTQQRIEKLQNLVKKKQQADSLKQQSQQIQIDTSQEAQKVKIHNYRKDSIFALDKFFQALYDLETQKSKKLIRVAHYGDSQIEGDRITLYLRKKFHKQFGGGGPGFIPIKDIYTPPAYSREASDNWIRYTMFHDIYINNRYGYGGLVFRFSNPKIRDSTIKKAYIAVSSNKYGNYTRAALLWGNTDTPCHVTTIIDGTVYQDNLPIQKEFGMITHHFRAGVPVVRYEFNAAQSPDIYGICLDDTIGVQIDNFALRGHGGQGIFKMSAEYLKSQYKALNTKLIILQYGGNGIPYVTGEESAAQFEAFFYEMVMFMKRANPDASILMISASDMAHKVDGHYQSYSGLGLAVNAQRRACERAGVAFWNLFEVMGGQGSILDWANQNPPLATSDFIHFSEKGCALVADLLYDALMNEYALFKKRIIQQRAKSLEKDIHHEIKRLP